MSASEWEPKFLKLSARLKERLGVVIECMVLQGASLADVTCDAGRPSLGKAHRLLREYDGSTVTAAAEIWAEEKLSMVKADKGAAGFDGTLPNGRKLQVKPKKADAHSDAGTYITLSKSTLELADDLLIVFVDDDTCEVTRTIGPVPISELSDRKGRYYVSDILKRQP